MRAALSWPAHACAVQNASSAAIMVLMGPRLEVPPCLASLSGLTGGAHRITCSANLVVKKGRTVSAKYRTLTPGVRRQCSGGGARRSADLVAGARYDRAEVGLWDRPASKATRV